MLYNKVGPFFFFPFNPDLSIKFQHDVCHLTLFPSSAALCTCSWRPSMPPCPTTFDASNQMMRNCPLSKCSSATEWGRNTEETVSVVMLENLLAIVVNFTVSRFLNDSKQACPLHIMFTQPLWLSHLISGIKQKG